MRDLTYPPIILACKTAFRLLGQRIDLQGVEHVPRHGGVLLAVNHISYVDFIYGGLVAEQAGRKPRFMAKKELFDHRYVGPLMRSLHHIEVDRAAGEASLAVALDYLERGEAVGIFPEATISRAMELKELKTPPSERGSWEQLDPIAELTRLIKQRNEEQARQRKTAYATMLGL